MTLAPVRWRRRTAILIRFRQEALKRLDALHGPRVDASESEYARLFREGRPPETLAVSPLARHLASHDRSAVPNLDSIRAEARRAQSGEWLLFGQPVRISGRDFHWLAHPISGQLAPLQPWNRLRYLRGEYGGDVKFIWELSRHKAALRLAQEWFATTAEGAASALANLLDTWMDQNPPGWGINWASSLEVAFRGVSWCWIAALTATAPLWSEQRRRRFLWFLWHHARHVERYDSVHHSPNTHLTGEALGLVYIGSCFPHFKHAEHWRRFGLAILVEEMKQQLLADGMHFERSTGYHRYTVEILLHTIALCRLAGRADEAVELEGPAQRATAVLAGLRRPDGTVPVLGEEDGGNAVPLATAAPREVAPLLAAAAGLFQRPEWLWNLAADSRDLAWWLLSRDAFQVMPTAKRPPAVGSLSLPSSGYYSAWETAGAEPWFCLVDGGPHGGDLTGHAHEDCAHLELAKGALLLAVDPGSSTYTGDLARREWERSAAAHATLLLESKPLAHPKGPFAWGLLPPASTAQVVETGAYWACRVTRRLGHGDQDPIHERQVVLLRGYGILVCDWLEGASDQPVRITWPILHGRERLRLEELRLRVADCASIQWYWSGLTGPSAVLAAHHFAPSYGESREGTALLLRGRAGPVALIATSFATPSLPTPAYQWVERRLQVALATTLFEFAPRQLPAEVNPPPPTG